MPLKLHDHTEPHHTAMSMRRNNVKLVSALLAVPTALSINIAAAEFPYRKAGES